jgi:phosphoglycolate phosphatase
MSFDLLVFDLDGTLIDSALDLALSVNAVRADADLEPLPHETVYTYVGNGAPMLIQRALDAEAADPRVERGLEFFYRYYHEHMLDNTDLYPGVREALDEWRDEGRGMAVLTNKPVRFTRHIIEGLGLNGRFGRVYGGNSFETKKPEPKGLEAIMRELNGVPAKTLMVGDSAVDVLTARNAKVTSAGVTYGLRPETFEEHPPDILVDSMPELAETLRSRQVDAQRESGPGRTFSPALG